MLDCHRGLCNAATGCPNCLSLTCGVRGWTRKRSFPLHVPRSPLASAFPRPRWSLGATEVPVASASGVEPAGVWTGSAGPRPAFRGRVCPSRGEGCFLAGVGCSDRGHHVLPTFPSLTSCQAHEPPIKCSLHKSTKPIFNFFSKLNFPLDWSQSQMIWG